MPLLSIDILIRHILRDVPLKESSVRNTLELLEDGATIPFISRYRKERTGNLDETQVRLISQKRVYYIELEERRATILKTIQEQGKLTPALEQQIRACIDHQHLEDLYLPYKPKKRTRATIAKEKGLEPLAQVIFSQQGTAIDKEAVLLPFVNKEKDVATTLEALQGACDIIAEQIADDADIRGMLRQFLYTSGRIASKVKKDWEGKKTKFENYYHLTEDIRTAPSHRILAVRRGTEEEVLSWSIQVDEERVLADIRRKTVKNPRGIFYDDLINTTADSWKRLLYPSLQNEVFSMKTQEAEKEAIAVFSRNLRNLLLAPPAGSKIFMGIDPGFRTGCKCAVVDRNGNLKEYSTMYPSDTLEQQKAKDTLESLITTHAVEIIAIGNGTASKETHAFVLGLIKEKGLNVSVLVVSEAGASVYSASEAAGREFPELDVTIRGAISIARRLQDPLAELVKIEPKSIGVGQYQHDVDQKELKNSLDFVVESCVNYVGVELNTASVELLSYVSGIGKAIAQNIVEYRTQHGNFYNRQDLLQVKKLGDKAFQQCAGFLRIRESRNPLDNSAIHPERYAVVEKIARDCRLNVDELIGNEPVVNRIELQNYVSADVGLPTLRDIVEELKKPGRDPRKEFSCVQFSSAVNTLEDLAVDMVLDGVVTNVTRFGAFVDIGVHQDGLVHISKMSEKFVKDPNDLLAVGDAVTVKVISVDRELKRIALQLVHENKDSAD